MKELLFQLPNVRGKQRVLSVLDGCFGPWSLKAAESVKIHGYLSSTQDAALCRDSGDCPLLIEEIDKLPKDGCFIDCGANCGYYSALCARRLNTSGHVISIEPSAREYSRLQWARANNDHSCLWTTFNISAGGDHGVSHIDTQVGHTGMNRISDRKQGTESCPMMPLDFVIQKFVPEDRTIDLMKIDVEGFEMSVLKGIGESLGKHRINRLVIEITDSFLKKNGHSKKELYALLSGFGYTSVVNSDRWQYDEIFTCSKAA